MRVFLEAAPGEEVPRAWRKGDGSSWVTQLGKPESGSFQTDRSSISVPLDQAALPCCGWLGDPLWGMAAWHLAGQCWMPLDACDGGAKQGNGGVSGSRGWQRIQTGGQVLDPSGPQCGDTCVLVVELTRSLCASPSPLSDADMLGG